MKPEDVPHRWLPAAEGGRYFADFTGYERLSATQQLFLDELAAKLEEVNLQGVDPASTIAELEDEAEEGGPLLTVTIPHRTETGFALWVQVGAGGLTVGHHIGESDLAHHHLYDFDFPDSEPWTSGAVEHVVLQLTTPYVVRSRAKERSGLLRRGRRILRTYPSFDESNESSS